MTKTKSKLHIERSRVAATTASLTAAVQTGLIQHLVDSPDQSAKSLARSAGTDPDATETVLDVLVGSGYVLRRGDRYGPAPVLASAADEPGGFARMLAMWSRTTHYLATGERRGRMDGKPAERGEAYRDSVRWLAEWLSDWALAIVDHYASRWPAPRRILDVGTGAGTWGIAFAQRFSDAELTGLDLPYVIPIFEERASELGVDGRVHTLAGDYRSADLPEAGYDLVILGNVLHLEGADAAQALVASMARTVSPAGKLMIIDAFDDGSAQSKTDLAVYRLSLALRTRGGRPYDEAQFSHWLRAAGLEEPETLRADAVGGAIVATRPAGD